MPTPRSSTTSGKAPANRVKAVDAAQAEADALDTYPVGSVILNGRPLIVKPVGEWRSSAMRALREGDLDTWAEKCLDPESWVIWQEIDPTLDEAGVFLEAWSAKTGEDAGK